MSFTLKPIVLLFDQIGVVICFVVMQRLQLVVCLNSFYGKVSSVDGLLLVSNINDTVSKKRAPFLFLRLLCVLLPDV